MNPIDDLLRAELGKTFTAASVEVRQQGAVLYRRAIGSLDPEGNLEGAYPRVTKATPFDYASLTKLFVTSALFRLIDAGHLTLDTPLGAILPEFNGLRPIAPYPNPLNTGEMVHVVPPTPAMVDAGAVRLRDLLTHSSGLPAWLNLREYPDVPSRRMACLTTPFAYPIGSAVVYSDVGYILIGLAIEKIAGARLDEAMKRLVQQPLDLSIRYGPVEGAPPTEFCKWRERRIVGEVHDENSATLGGIAGHAGLFGTANDCALLGQLYLAEGGGFISPRLAREATRQHIGDRGLGWMMRTPGKTSSGAHFSANSYGHTGFVGNSLWVDPERQLVCALLTNNVFFGRNPDAIYDFRVRFHDTLITVLEGKPV